MEGNVIKKKKNNELGYHRGASHSRINADTKAHA